MACVLGVSALACGGLGDGDNAAAPTAAATEEAAAPAPDPAIRQVAFQTYNASGGRYRLKFTSDTKVKATWRNMSGSAVEVSYTQTGNELELDWGTPANTSKRKSKMRVLDDCQLVQYWWIDEDNVEHDDPLMYVRDDARCKH